MPLLEFLLVFRSSSKYVFPLCVVQDVTRKSARTLEHKYLFTYLRQFTVREALKFLAQYIRINILFCVTLSSLCAILQCHT